MKDNRTVLITGGAGFIGSHLAERLLAQGGWGAKVPAKTLKPGQSGASVVALRNRLIAMGFLKRTNTQAYDTSVHAAVQQFQLAHGLAADGVVGAARSLSDKRQPGDL